MHLELSTEQAEVLADQLDQDLGHLSHEIATTGDPGERAHLNVRLNRLAEVTKTLRHLLASDGPVPDELIRELAQPGD